MSQEIEAKFRIADPEPFRQALRRPGAEQGGRVLEINRIFDTPERRLLAADCGLRGSRAAADFRSGEKRCQEPFVPSTQRAAPR